MQDWTVVLEFLVVKLTSLERCFQTFDKWSLTKKNAKVTKQWNEYVAPWKAVFAGPLKLKLFIIFQKLFFIVLMSMFNYNGNRIHETLIKHEFDNRSDLDLTSTVIWNAWYFVWKQKIFISIIIFQENCVISNESNAEPRVKQKT